MKIQELKAKLENKSKAEIRRIIRDYRDAMPSNEVEKRSANIHRNLFAFEEYINAMRIMLYASFRNEVDTRKIIDNLIMNGKKAYLPLVRKDSATLEVYKINDFEKDTVVGSFGVMEPKTIIEKCNSLEDIQLFLIPGIVFDRNGNRIGWGKGYYDNFLGNLSKQTKKYALAYDFQVIGKIDATKNDVPIDGLITESGVLRFHRN